MSSQKMKNKPKKKKDQFILGNKYLRFLPERPQEVKFIFSCSGQTVAKISFHNGSIFVNTFYCNSLAYSFMYHLWLLSATRAEVSS